LILREAVRIRSTFTFFFSWHITHDHLLHSMIVHLVKCSYSCLCSPDQVLDDAIGSWTSYQPMLCKDKRKEKKVSYWYM
jgi:hypothetical protein